jgi:lipopolysaccharide/colanic/teichoic acid biosynthesis glycosyltransferase
MTRRVRATKRTLDVFLATLGLSLTIPLYPFIAAAIYLESPGTIFFRQRRAGELLGPLAGQRGRFRFREFHMLKFRSMRPNAEAHSGPVLAKEKDPRITRVGRFLRKTRLDELPQFINVLRGEMSIIGPRPERPELMVDLALAIPFFEERMDGIKPGITGLAQVSLGYAGRPPDGSELAKLSSALTNPFKIDGAEGALADDMRMKLLCDLAYSLAAEKWATFARMEAEILLRTPLVMLQGLGRKGLGR